jgi:hypothetical protein
MAEPVTKLGDIIPTIRGTRLVVTHAEMQQRPRADGPGTFGFVLVFVEDASKRPEVAKA